MSEISTHRQRKEKIERGHEGKRVGSLIPVLPPPGFKIVKMLTR